MILLHVIVLAVTAALAWTLSRFDGKLTGEDTRKDMSRRGLRCAVTLVLVELALGNLIRWARYQDSFSGYTFLVLGVPLAAVWCGCLTEMFAEWFHHLLDPQDHREVDFEKSKRGLDQLASLVQAGRREDAIALCKQLKASGDASALAMETMLERLGAVELTAHPEPTADAGHLVQQGLNGEAENKSNPMPAKDPESLTGALSVDELLVAGCLGTAIEILEQKAKAQPNDFEIWLKLAEAHGRYCRNQSRARKTVARIEANPTFKPEQVQRAKAQMLEWQK